MLNDSSKHWSISWMTICERCILCVFECMCVSVCMHMCGHSSCWIALPPYFSLTRLLKHVSLSLSLQPGWQWLPAIASHQPVGDQLLLSPLFLSIPLSIIPLSDKLLLIKPFEYAIVFPKGPWWRCEVRPERWWLPSLEQHLLSNLMWLPSILLMVTLWTLTN